MSIESLEVIEGQMRRRALVLVLEWAALHREELRQAWDVARRNQEADKIEPLDKFPFMTLIIEATPMEGYRLKVRFNDGFEGVYAVDPEHRGGGFLRLRAPAAFNEVRVNADFGCVEWPCGVDLCPASMHQEMLAPATAAAAR